MPHVRESATSLFSIFQPYLAKYRPPKYFKIQNKRLSLSPLPITDTKYNHIVVVVCLFLCFANLLHDLLYRGSHLTVKIRLNILHNCLFQLDPCATNPCLNGGRCQRSGSTTYTCICSVGYTGNNCNIGRYTMIR